MIRIIDISDAYDLLKRRNVRLSQAEKVVAPIIDAVRKRGDAALYQYAKKLDGLGKEGLALGGIELEARERGILSRRRGLGADRPAAAERLVQPDQ